MYLNVSFRWLIVSGFVLILFFAGCQKTHEDKTTIIWKKDLIKGWNNRDVYYPDVRMGKSPLYAARFKSGFFYISPGGETLYSHKIEEENRYYCVSKNYYLLYNLLPDKKNKLKGRIFEFYDNNGSPVKVRKKPPFREKFPIPTNGVKTKATPRISPEGELIATFDSGGTDFALYDKKGKMLVSPRTYGPLITSYAFSNKNAFFAVGYITGHVVLFNSKGREVFSKKIKIGNYSVVKSVFVSDNGEYVGLVAGLFSEYVIVLNKKGEVIWSLKTGSNQRTRVFGCFSSGDGKRVIIGLNGGAAIYSNPEGNLIRKLTFYRNDTKRFMLFNASGNQKGDVILSFSLKNNSIVFFVSSKGVVRRHYRLDDDYIYTSFFEDGSGYIMQGNKNIYCFKYFF
jgi:outer membrane protein assembly factor BamB